MNPSKSSELNANSLFKTSTYVPPPPGFYSLAVPQEKEDLSQSLKDARTPSPKTQEQYDRFERATLNVLTEEEDHFLQPQTSLMNYTDSPVYSSNNYLKIDKDTHSDTLNVDVDQCKELIQIYVSEGKDSRFIHEKLENALKKLNQTLPEIMDTLPSWLSKKLHQNDVEKKYWLNPKKIKKGNAVELSSEQIFMEVKDQIFIYDNGEHVGYKHNKTLPKLVKSSWVLTTVELSTINPQDKRIQLTFNYLKNTYFLDAYIKKDMFDLLLKQKKFKLDFFCIKKFERTPQMRIFYGERSKGDEMSFFKNIVSKTFKGELGPSITPPTQKNSIKKIGPQLEQAVKLLDPSSDLLPKIIDTITKIRRAHTIKEGAKRYSYIQAANAVRDYLIELYEEGVFKDKPLLLKSVIAHEVDQLNSIDLTFKHNYINSLKRIFEMA